MANPHEIPPHKAPDPCPFCGSIPSVFVSIHGLFGHPDRYALAHPDNECIISGAETSSYQDIDELIDDWNRRV